MLSQQICNDVHSDEFDEIISRVPSWLYRWGVFFFFTFLAILTASCYFIKYPETISARISLTSDNPPSDLVARSTGILDTVTVYDGKHLTTGELIALISNAANYGDVTTMEKFLTSGSKKLPDGWQNFVLGGLQQAWITYLAALSDYEDYCRIDRTRRKRELITSQIKQSEDYYKKLEVQRKTLEEELEYERTAVYRDSVLLSKMAISQAEYENALKALASKQSSLAGFDASMSNARLNMMQMEQQILELETQRTEEMAGYERRIEQARNTLISNISQWKEQYAIIAPCDGTVSLQNVWSSGQHVSAGSLIASVTPKAGAEVVGRLKVPSSGFGKVKTGQNVNIKLNGFPYLEFGILKGEVKSISSVPERSEHGLCYTVVVSLPSGLESTYRKEFPFVQDMDGTAEIITEDMRLIEQFVRPIRSLFTNR